MHMHPAQTPVIMTGGAWQTPLGELPVAEDLATHLADRFDFEVEAPHTPNRDNTIELQLPFVRHFFGPVPIVPIGVPPATLALQIADAVVTYARERNRRIKIIGSTDLTHYGPNYAFTGQGQGAAAVKWVREDNDRRFIDALLALAPGRIIDEARRRQNACCAGAAAACVEAAMGLGAREGQLKAYATSHDKSPGESFVGYAGVVFL
jgi:AmmeMemoRadiSam system protein B